MTKEEREIAERIQRELETKNPDTIIEVYAPEKYQKEEEKRLLSGSQVTKTKKSD